MKILLIVHKIITINLMLINILMLINNNLIQMKIKQIINNNKIINNNIISIINNISINKVKTKIITCNNKILIIIKIINRIIKTIFINKIIINKTIFFNKIIINKIIIKLIFINKIISNNITNIIHTVQVTRLNKIINKMTLNIQSMKDIINFQINKKILSKINIIHHQIINHNYQGVMYKMMHKMIKPKLTIILIRKKIHQSKIIYQKIKVI
jgi:hypothetical protein